MRHLLYSSVILIIIAVIITPFTMEAHVKWFTELEPEKEAIEQILSPLFLILTILSALLLAVLPQIVPKMMQWQRFKRLDKKLESFRPFTINILKYGTAIALVIQSLSGSIFAPEVTHNSIVIQAFTWLTIILLLIPNPFTTKIAATILFILFVTVTISYGIFHMLDYGFYLAIIFVLFMTKTKYESWSFPFLYLATGLSLCWVAVEKWVYPDMALDIVTMHNVPTFFLPAATFVSLSAFIEFIVGYLLVVGILNRLLAFVLTCIFIMTTILFGWVEVAGHFMIHIILVIFIIEGVSFYKPPIKIHKTVLDQMIFVFLNFIFVLSTILLIYYRFA
ncbi:DoxX family membrane protein [Bacillus sp. JCM 19034]|uniref:DoxX family membrane protein n=1 Tax=Bacillus sp. JCM 19034 TaxID=1481928 RepID=UPI0007837B68|nr:DoxX family membrane protein [Bacillus sp. JCM 19034]